MLVCFVLPFTSHLSHYPVQQMAVNVHVQLIVYNLICIRRENSHLLNKFQPLPCHRLKYLLLTFNCNICCLLKKYSIDFSKTAFGKFHGCVFHIISLS